MKRIRKGMGLLAIVASLVSTLSGCASELDASEETEGAFGETEKTPFDVQTVAFSLLWNDPEVIFHGGYADCDVTISLSTGSDPRWTTVGSAKLNEYGNPSLKKGKLDGSLVIMRTNLTSEELIPSIGLYCRQRDTYKESADLVNLSPVRLTDALKAPQKFVLAAVGSSALSVDAKSHGLKFSLTASVTSSAPATGLLSNCSALSSTPKDQIQKTYMSATSLYPFQENEVTSTIHIDGGKLKKESEVKSSKPTFVPIVFCRAKAGAPAGIAFEAFGSNGDLAKNKPFQNVSAEGNAPLSSEPMKSGETRVVKHLVPKSNGDFTTVLKVY